MRVWRRRPREPVRSIQAVPVREAALVQWLQAFERQVQAVRPEPWPPSAPPAKALAAVVQEAAREQLCRLSRWFELRWATPGRSAWASLQTSKVLPCDRPEKLTKISPETA